MTREAFNIFIKETRMKTALKKHYSISSLKQVSSSAKYQIANQFFCLSQGQVKKTTTPLYIKESVLLHCKHNIWFDEICVLKIYCVFNNIASKIFIKRAHWISRSGIACQLIIRLMFCHVVLFGQFVFKCTYDN